MAEKIVSPGVFTNEIDQSFLPAAIADIGAALIGPTVKGPAGIPTVVTSYSEYQQIFGDVLNTGSQFQFLTSHTAEQYLKNSNTLTVVRILDGTYNGASAEVSSSEFQETYRTPHPAITASAIGNAFKLTTLADGAAMNNRGVTAGDDGSGVTTSGFRQYHSATSRLHNTTGSNTTLLSGSKDNVRWEVTNRNEGKGTFTLNIRRGDDSSKRKQVLESYSNISLDPNTNNYIGKAIGTQYETIGTDENGKPFLKLVGDYPRKSKYVRVSEIVNTVNYLDENGEVRVSSSIDTLPSNGSGSNWGTFTGGSDGFQGFDSLGNPSGTDDSVCNFYEDISATNSQGFDPTTAASGKSSYEEALDLLSNQDEYDINLILVPGIIGSVHPAVATKVIDVCEDRGDCFAIIDPVEYGKNVADATEQAESRDSN